jgi:hypothetical protein
MWRRNMERFLIFLVLTSLLLPACGGPPAPDQGEPERTSDTATHTVQPIKTPTPPPVGTWETVIGGVVYDRLSEPGDPIVGASISYDVLHSYYPELQQGRTNNTTTDELGEFALPVIVHDTDSIRVLIEAQGYISYEERLVGVDLFGGRSLDIGLTPILTATVSPP